MCTHGAFALPGLFQAGLFVVSVAVAMSVVVRISMTVAVVGVGLVLAVVVAIIEVLLCVKLVAVELVLPARMPASVGMFAARRKGTVVSKARIVVVIDVSVESLGSMEPWPGAKKHAACKPLGTVVAKRRAPVRRVIVVTVGANRGHSDADADLCG